MAQEHASTRGFDTNGNESVHGRRGAHFHKVTKIRDIAHGKPDAVVAEMEIMVKTSHTHTMPSILGWVDLSPRAHPFAHRTLELQVGAVEVWAHHTTVTNKMPTIQAHWLHHTVQTNWTGASDAGHGITRRFGKLVGELGERLVQLVLQRICVNGWRRVRDPGEIV